MWEDRRRIGIWLLPKLPVALSVGSIIQRPELPHILTVFAEALKLFNN